MVAERSSASACRAACRPGLRTTSMFRMVPFSAGGAESSPGSALPAITCADRSPKMAARVAVVGSCEATLERTSSAPPPFVKIAMADESGCMPSARWPSCVLGKVCTL